MTAWKDISTFDYNKYLNVNVLVRGQNGVAVAFWDDEENAFLSDLRGRHGAQTVYGPVAWMEIPD